MAALAVVIVILAISSSVSAQTVGGATSGAKFAADLVGKYNQAPTPTRLLAYASVGSGVGKANFLSGAYLVGFSDDPLTTLEDQTFATNVCGAGASSVTCPFRYTIPVALATFNFFYNAGTPNCKISAALSLSLFKGGAWGGNCGLAGNAVSYVRDGSSGSTFVITTYWSKFVGGVTPTQAILPFGTAKVSGTAMCGAISAKALSIGYSQVGNCYGLSKVSQAALLNKAGQYTFYAPGATGWDTNLCVTQQYPASTASFATLGDDMIGSLGLRAPAMCSFLYTFARAPSKQKTVALAKVNYGFYVVALGYGSTRLPVYLYSSLPGNAVSKNTAALAALKA